MATNSHAAWSVSRAPDRQHEPLRRPAAVSTRSTVAPSDDPSAASASSSSRPSALRPDRHGVVAPWSARRPPGSATATHRQHVGRRHRADDLGQPHIRATAASASTATRRSLSRWRCGPIGLPPHDRASAWRSTIRSTPSSVSFCTIHSGRSAFGIAKPTVIGSRARRDRGHVARRRAELAAGDTARPPATGAVGDGDGLAVAQRSTRKRWWCGGVVERRAASTSATTTWAAARAQRRAHCRGIDHENADLILENRPPASATDSPRPSAYWRSRSDFGVDELGRHLDPHDRPQVAATAAVQVAARRARAARTRAPAGCRPATVSSSSPSSVASVDLACRAPPGRSRSAPR